jgi:hypothetical protein
MQARKTDARAGCTISQGELYKSTQVTPHVVVETFAADGMARTYFRYDSLAPETAMDQFNITQSPVVLPESVVNQAVLHEAVVASVLAERCIWDDVIDAAQADAWFVDTIRQTLLAMGIDSSKRMRKLEAEQWDTFVHAVQLALGSHWRVEHGPGEGERDIMGTYRQEWTCTGRCAVGTVVETQVHQYASS